MVPGCVRDRRRTVKDVREVRQGALPVMEVEVAISGAHPGRSRRDHRFPAALPTASKGAPQNGVRFLGNVPGMPRTRRAERVLLFLGPASSGGSAPIGLQQGKFSLSGGNALNAMNNRGLFRGVTAPRANDGESSVLGPRTARSTLRRGGTGAPRRDRRLLERRRAMIRRTRAAGSWWRSRSPRHHGVNEEVGTASTAMA